MRLIDADALELEGWYLSRNYRVDSRTMCFETKDIKKVPTAQPENARINARKTHACDCINRQAAIDKVDRIVKVNHLNPDMVWFTPNGVKTLMEDLPSAEPDIIACGDCKHWICHDRRCGYWNHGVKPLDWCCHAEGREE